MNECHRLKFNFKKIFAAYLYVGFIVAVFSILWMLFFSKKTKKKTAEECINYNENKVKK